MKKKNSPGGCCCCMHLYGGNQVCMGNFKKMPGDPIIAWPPTPYPDPLRWPADSNISVTTAGWEIDHYNELCILGGNSGTRAVDKTAAKFPDAIADVVIDNIITLSSPELLRAVSSIGVEQRVIYVVQLDTNSTSWEIRECDHDGSNITAFSVSPVTNISGVLHCRADDKLYYGRSHTGVDGGRRCLYRCERDGTGQTLVYDPGSGFNFQPGQGWSIDNVNEKIYLMQNQSSTTSFGRLIEMDLDGSNQTTLYTTLSLGSPHTGYGIRHLKYSHLKKRVYFVIGSARSTALATDLTEGGLWELDPLNPSAAKHLKSAQQVGVISDIANLRDGLTWFDLGCGFETMGIGTKR